MWCPSSRPPRRRAAPETAEGGVRMAVLVLAVLAAVLPAPSQQGPADPVETLRAAAAAFDAGDLPAAIQHYRAFLSEYTEAAEIRSNLGAALVANGQIEEAIREYRLALKHLPNNPRVRMNLALAYYKTGRPEEAARELAPLIEMQPLDPKPALLMADCLVMAGRPEAAVELLAPLADEYPRDRAIAYTLGMAYLRANDEDRAQLLLDRILRDGNTAESEFLFGQLEFRRQNLLKAAGHLARAVELNPQLPGVHSLYGQVLRSNGRLEEAAEQFRLELENNPFEPVANIELAMLRKQEGQLEEALRHLARALQVRPGDPGVLLQRASIYASQGRLELARQELEALVSEYPHFAEAHATLATVYYRLKRTPDGDRARDAARRARLAGQAQPGAPQNPPRAPVAKPPGGARPSGPKQQR